MADDGADRDGARAVEMAPGTAPDGPAEIASAGDLWRQISRRRGALVVSLLVTGAALWMLQRGALPVVPSPQILAGVEPWTVPAYALLFGFGQFLRGYRWRALLSSLVKLRTREVVGANYVFFAALLLIPLRLGEFVRPALMRRKARLSGWQVLGLSGAERIVDGLIASLMVLWALLFSGAEVRTDLSGPAALVRPTAVTMAAVFTTGLAGAVVFFLFRGFARRVTHAVVGIVSPELGHRIAHKVESIADGLRAFRSPASAVSFVATSAVYWAAMVLGMVVLLRGCGLPGAGLPEAASVCGVLALGILVPGAPGFFGTFQLSAYAGLTVFVVDEALHTAGAAVVFWMYVVQVSTILLTGGLFLPATMRWSRRVPS